MRILVAPDKFKGSLSAVEVARHLRNGMLSADESVECVLLPLADGGEGSVDAAVATGYRALPITVEGPTGESHETSIAFDGETAVIEVASSCGIGALPGGRLEPLRSSSFGVGQAMLAALALAPSRIVIALGGSASTDGGIGMLAALGVGFRDSDGAELRADGAALESISSIDTSAIVDFGDTTLVAASDVTSPLTGPSGAATVFGPQKGASPRNVARLDAGLHALVELFATSGFPEARASAESAGSGSAGGLGFGSLLLGASIVSGADFFLDLLDFDRHVAGCDLVVTGEGSLDDQTASGKLVARVAARSAGIPVVAVAGRVTLGPEDLGELGIGRAIAISDLTGESTAGDSQLSARLLEQIGRAIIDDRSVAAV